MPFVDWHNDTKVIWAWDDLRNQAQMYATFLMERGIVFLSFTSKDINELLQVVPTDIVEVKPKELERLNEALQRAESKELEAVGNLADAQTKIEALQTDVASAQGGWTLCVRALHAAEDRLLDIREAHKAERIQLDERISEQRGTLAGLQSSYDSAVARLKNHTDNTKELAEAKAKLLIAEKSLQQEVDFRVKTCGDLKHRCNDKDERIQSLEETNTALNLRCESHVDANKRIVQRLKEMLGSRFYEIDSKIQSLISDLEF